MHTKLKVITAVVVALFWTVSAKAEPPKEGEQFVGEGFLCDTDQNAQDLFKASQDKSGQGIVNEYMRLNALKNDRGEPTCMYGTITHGITVVKVTSLGIGYGITGNAFDIWMLDIVGKEGFTGTIFYPELHKEAVTSGDTKS